MRDKAMILFWISPSPRILDYWPFFIHLFYPAQVKDTPTFEYFASLEYAKRLSKVTQFLSSKLNKTIKLPIQNNAKKNSQNCNQNNQNFLISQVKDTPSFDYFARLKQTLMSEKVYAPTKESEQSDSEEDYFEVKKAPMMLLLPGKALERNKYCTIFAKIDNFSQF